MKLIELKEIIKKELGDKAHMLDVYTNALIDATVKETADKAVELTIKSLKERLQDGKD
jgi:hypothetical protein